MNAHTISRRTAVLATLATAAAAPSLVAAAPVPEEGAPAVSEIAALFAQWKAIRDCDFLTLTEAQADAQYERYVALQRRIAAMEPSTAAELAMMLIVETDDGDSVYRDSFFRKVRRIAKAAMKPAAGVTSDGATTIEEQLEEAAFRFRETAQLIDPTIQGASYGFDHDFRNDGKAPLFFVHLVRDQRHEVPWM